MLSEYDRRRFTGQKLSDRAAEYYRESGILALLLQLEANGVSQENSAKVLIAQGYENVYGDCLWNQSSVCRILRRARERGEIPAPTC